ncbi:hypothetical protein [Nannocystis pusilla]|uniref:hypothetical protein n=1 Tax=Nannocystis pusilla TaxID=889268 RepID=UPI003B7A4A08
MPRAGRVGRRGLRRRLGRRRQGLALLGGAAVERGPQGDRGLHVADAAEHAVEHLARALVAAAPQRQGEQRLVERRRVGHALQRGDEAAGDRRGGFAPQRGAEDQHAQLGRSALGRGVELGLGEGQQRLHARRLGGVGAGARGLDQRAGVGQVGVDGLRQVAVARLEHDRYLGRQHAQQHDLGLRQLGRGDHRRVALRVVDDALEVGDGLLRLGQAERAHGVAGRGELARLLHRRLDLALDGHRRVAAEVQHALADAGDAEHDAERDQHAGERVDPGRALLRALDLDDDDVGARGPRGR